MEERTQNRGTVEMKIISLFKDVKVSVVAVEGFESYHYNHYKKLKEIG